MFNSQVEEQLHLQFDSNKKFLNMMTSVTHIYLFRSILDHHNINNNKTVTNLLQQKTRLNLFLTILEGCSLQRIQIQTSILLHYQAPYSKEKTKID